MSGVRGPPSQRPGDQHHRTSLDREPNLEPQQFAPPRRGGNEPIHPGVSQRPPLDLERHLDYLVTYPHGCAEQIASGAFPQLYLRKITNLSPAQAERIDQHVQSAIRRLDSYRTGEGGFGYWPNSLQSHLWASSWVGHFLIEAQRAGYHVPEKTLAMWRQHQSRRARGQVRTGDELSQAYRLYTLALAKQPELSAMNRLRSRQGLSSAARWRLAAAYALAGQAGAARG